MILKLSVGPCNLDGLIVAIEKMPNGSERVVKWDGSAWAPDSRVSFGDVMEARPASEFQLRQVGIIK